MFLKTEGITKDYGNGKGAFGVDLNVMPGEVVGFIGPNGAGKSTTLSMIAGYNKPTSGSFTLFDHAISWGQVPKYNPRLIIMPSEAYFGENLIVEEILNRSLLLLDAQKERLDYLVDVFRLDLQKKFSSLSLGNRKKVSLIATLMADSDLYIFDEPTSGLDPLMQQVYLEELRTIRSKNKSVLLSSHVLSEIQAVCDRLYMIKAGKIIFMGDTKKILLDSFKIINVFHPTKALIKDLKKASVVEQIREHSDRIEIFTKLRAPVVQILLEHNVEDFFVERPQLEEMFLESYK